MRINFYEEMIMTIYDIAKEAGVDGFVAECKPEDKIKLIFDKYYRSENHKREVVGTGLGLSIVKDTIENRGGTISAGHGANGVGTVFTVYLPLAERGEEA